MSDIATHDPECECPPCLVADIHRHVAEMRGEAAAMRLRLATGNYRHDSPQAERTRFATPGTRSGNGVVREISPKQLRFLKTLLATREISAELRAKRWFTTDVDGISLAGARTLIDALLACPETTPASTVRMASPKQAEWLGKLAGKDVPAEIEAIRLQGADATFADASKALDVLFKARSLPTVRTVDGALPAPITDGLYLIPATPDADERVIKVQIAVNGSGNLYGKELIDGEFVYLGAGILRSLTPAMRMSREQAGQYGKLYGFCIRCGRTLTDEYSIANGIGKICAEKM